MLSNSCREKLQCVKYWLHHSYTAPAHHKSTVHGLLVQCLACSNLSQQGTGDRITWITDSVQSWDTEARPPQYLMLSCSALGVGRGFLQSFFLCFPEWVTSQGANTDSGLHNYGHPHFYDLFLTVPGAGSRAQAQTTESKHSLSEVRDTRQVFINLLVTNHKDTISSCPRIDYFMKEILFLCWSPSLLQG